MQSVDAVRASSLQQKLTPFQSSLASRECGIGFLESIAGHRGPRSFATC